MDEVDVEEGMEEGRPAIDLYNPAVTLTLGHVQFELQRRDQNRGVD